ncbi:hypothetical protein MUP32_02125, partial [Candidatus Microgenomates bacterium]|nr:hypothetical protein [Candidatus Microgenomates bacterium]
SLHSSDVTLDSVGMTIELFRQPFSETHHQWRDDFPRWLSDDQSDTIDIGSRFEGFTVMDIIEIQKTPLLKLLLCTEIYLDQETPSELKSIIFTLLSLEIKRLLVDSQERQIFTLDQLEGLSDLLLFLSTEKGQEEKDLIAKIRLIFKDYIPSFDLAAFEDRFILDNIIVFFIILVFYYSQKESAAYSIEKIVSHLNLQKRYCGRRKPGKVYKKLPQKQVLFDYRLVKFCRLLVNYGHNVTQ